MLYTEKQFKEYEKFMDKIANIDDIAEGFGIHLELKDWIEVNNLSETAIEQMDERLEKEFAEETSKKSNKDFKIIQFSKELKEE